MRVPWSKRQSPEQTEEFWKLSDQVPVGLTNTLVEHVIREFFVQEMYGPTRLNRELANKFARIHNQYLDENIERTWRILSSDQTLLLDAFDFVLGLLNAANLEHQRRVLVYNAQLMEARFSHYIAPDGSGSFELQRRLSEEFISLVAASTTINDRASEHLRRALSCIYGMNRDPNTACIEAVRAIEVVASPVIAPNADSMRLGQMIKEIDKRPDAWMTVLGLDEDVETFSSLLKWTLQSHFRHGDPNQPIEPTTETAEMVVQLAVLLVSWFRSERFGRRRDT